MLFPERPDDHATWIEAWERVAHSEPMAHPAFIGAFGSSADRVLALYWRENDGEILLPMMLKELPKELSDSGFDLVTPYGYGGAFVRGQVNADAFWARAFEWANEQEIVSLFARLSLFPERILPFPGEVVHSQNNIVLDLREEPEKMWMAYEHKVRKNVKKALGNNLTVELDPDGERIDDFLDIYYGTMDRREAREEYHFPRSSFDALMSSMRSSLMFFHVMHEEKVISTELALLSDETMYSFLGGTHEEFFALRPNDLLKHEMIRWGHERGLHNFVFGGGAQPDDGIYKYKRSFAPEGVVPFYVGRLILNEQRYGELVDARKSLAAESGIDWKPRESFFPSYRDTVGA